NPLARVKIATDGISKADVKANVIHVERDAPTGKIAHELRHLQLATELEPHYRAVAETAKIDPSRARNQFMNMRAYAEFQARMMEGLVDTKTSADTLSKLVENASQIGEMKASNGKTYAQNWQAEWQQLKKDSNFRPRNEYDGSQSEQLARSNEKTDSTVLSHTKLPDIKVTSEAALGSPDPMGATVLGPGTNFAVRSRGATRMELLLFGPGKTANDSTSMQTLSMNRTGDVWHRFVKGAGHGSEYLYRAFGTYNPALDGTRFNGNMALLDPYSKAVTGDTRRPLAYDNNNPSDPNRHLRPGDVDSVKDMSRSVVVDSKFEWQGDKPPATPMTDSVIYELHVKGFTGGLEHLGRIAGTYRGMIEKIPHLRRLGVTAVELMPISQFEKIDNFNGSTGEGPRNPTTGELLLNQWGYQTIAYQAPEASYAADGNRGQQVNEFKSMVRELHKNKIEVILDVVFNHTAEDGSLGPTISFRGLDNNVYYMLAPTAPEKYIDHTGCRNTLNVNEPAVQNLILDTLKYWVKEMHVDGFRFDLATVFNYDTKNVDQARTPILERMTTDPDLAN
ncbi:MAG: hypothetical protein K8F91_01305, partial [Candidatus Obscuribacterales bacterium]|nr:hypothetical protein [Candidatus Obscuribacterales bacterium]